MLQCHNCKELDAKLKDMSVTKVIDLLREEVYFCCGYDRENGESHPDLGNCCNGCTQHTVMFTFLEQKFPEEKSKRRSRDKPKAG